MNDVHSMNDEREVLASLFVIVLVLRRSFGVAFCFFNGSNGVDGVNWVGG